MMLVLMITVVTGVLATTTLKTTHPPMGGTTPDANPVIDGAFKLIDADGNGHIDISEFLGLFDQYDTNSDGKLSLKEYTHNSQLPVDDTFAKEVYKIVDDDHDGFITRGDMNKIFKQYDKNNNGVINEHEFIVEYTRIYQAIVKDLGYAPTFQIPIPTTT